MQTNITCAGSPPAATCATPDQVVVTGTFAITFQPGQEFAFNPQNYLVQVRKDPIAAAGSGVVLQLKCIWSNGDFSGYGGTLPPGAGIGGGSAYPTPDCRSFIGATGMLNSSICTPIVCPSGFTDSGSLTTEVVQLAPVGAGGGMVGHCVRTCLK